MSVIDYGTGAQNLGNVTGIDGGSPNTGEMRRKYNFAEKFTELSIDQTPFFRIVSKIGTKPTDDPQFKFTEKRQSWMKRYGYCVGVGTASANQSADSSLSSVIAAQSYLYMATDYLSQGNIQNIIGQTGKAIGATGTRPEFFLPNQIVKIPVGSAAGGSMSDYRLYQIESVVSGWFMTADDGGNSKSKGDWITTLAGMTTPANVIESVQLKVVIVRDDGLAGDSHMVNFAANGTIVTAASLASDNSTTIAEHLEPKRSYVVGSSYEEGSTLMQKNWADQPYSTGFGYTQIFRNEFGMTNTARATALKYEKNEWARLWTDKLIEHKYEIEQTALFGKQGTYTSSDGTKSYQTTQGAVDYVLTKSNIFNLATPTKTEDDFLDDLSQLVDPRYNNAKNMMFFCDTATYNWLHKLGGYFNNNLEMSTNHSASFAMTGKKKSFGIDFTTISTVYGDINVARNIALDGSGVKMLGMNMNYVKWRPLVANGVNRSTSVYVGVQNLENTGTDKRVDMILTEGGFEFSMPECHALWK